MSLLVKALLAPWLMIQGRQVRARALKLPEAQGLRQGLEDGLTHAVGEALAKGLAAPAGSVAAGASGSDARPVLRLLVLGDSSGAGVGVEHQHQALAQPLAAELARRLGGPVSWQLLARTGHNSADALRALEQAANSGLHQPADLLVTALGVNDVVDQVSGRSWLQTLEQIRQLASQAAGVRWVLHSGLPPMHLFPLLPQPLRWVLGQDAHRLDAALRAQSTQTKQSALLAQPIWRHVALPNMQLLGAQALGPQLGQPSPEIHPQQRSALEQAITEGWIAQDGFHPGWRGYQAWVQALADTYEEL